MKPRGRHGAPTRSPGPHAVWIAALTLLLGSCSEARLYGAERPASQADRFVVSGTVCTEDALTSRLPLRLVLVADRAAGPLFSDYDPGAERIGLLEAFVQGALNDASTELAVVGYAGSSRKLAPLEGNFTRNPGELLAAISQLSLPESCAGDGRCRDYQEGLRTARTLIEGDMAATPAGRRVVTQYAVVLLVAGPHAPLATVNTCCLDDDTECLSARPDPSQACQSQLEQAQMAALTEAVESSGALGIKLHVLHLAANDAETDDSLQAGFSQLAFAGAGTYQRLGAAGALPSATTGILSDRDVLAARTLTVSNIHARPGADGPVIDSDGDGLSDEEEAEAGTDPRTRDTDDDGIGDLVETLVGLRPLTRDEPAACRTIDPRLDRDYDGLGDCDEALLGTEPTLVDSDGDAIPDLIEVIGFTDYLVPDASDDSDGDGVSNGQELRNRTDARSTDVRAHPASAYRYEIHDRGFLTELVGIPLVSLSGIDESRASAGSTAGISRIEYQAQTQSLRWRDAADSEAGPWVPVTGDDPIEVELPSSSWAPIQGEQGAVLRATIDPTLLPEQDVGENLRISAVTRQCLDYTVRNIRLLQTLEVSSDPGRDSCGPQHSPNTIRLFFAQSPASAPDRPGPFKIAEVPVQFCAPSRRLPEQAILELDPGRFVAVR